MFSYRLLANLLVLWISAGWTFKQSPGTPFLVRMAKVYIPVLACFAVARGLKWTVQDPSSIVMASNFIWIATTAMWMFGPSDGPKMRWYHELATMFHCAVQLTRP